MDVGAWLAALGLDRYSESFAANDIDGETLPGLSAEDLKELGVASLGHRKRLLAAIAALSAGESPMPGEPRLAERRQATVVFADLCGFTALSGRRDAEAVHALLERLFAGLDAAVARFGGTVDKHIGDAVMALFGVPVAHEDDALRALAAALEMHAVAARLGEAMGEPLALHVGVAAGEVVAAGVAADEHTVVGQSVNLAARLCESAGAGETLLSDAVERVVAGRAACTAKGALAVKGFAAPVAAWRLDGLREAAPPRTPFVGRRAEIAQVRGLIAATAEAGAGHLVHVRGEAGIGKSRLVEELGALAEAAGFARHTGLVLDFGTGKGRDAVRAIVRSLLGVAPGGGKGARHAAAAEALAKGWIAEDQAVYLNDLLDLAQPLALKSLYDAMDDAQRQRGKGAVVAAIAEAASREGPVLLIVEDLHWADAITLDHLARLAAVTARARVVVVLTSRVEGDPIDRGWRAGAGGASLATIDLGRLRADEAAALAGRFVETSRRVMETCVARAEGNPLFLEQLLRNAEESGDEAVPPSIQSLVLARMDRLPTRDRQALQAASVIGQRFALATLRRLIGDPAYACDALVAHYLVRPEGPDLLFAHALVQEAVYASLLRARAAALHRRAAGWFADHDPVLHARHLERAGAPEAARAFARAAAEQMAAYRFERAAEMVARGLALAEEASDRLALTALEGEVLHDQGKAAPSIAAFERALALAETDEDRCQAWLGLAAGMRLTDRYDEAFDCLEKAQRVAESGGMTAELARLHHLRGNLLFPLGRTQGCQAEHEKALEYARRVASPEAEARALSGLGDALYARMRMISAHALFERCIALCRDHGFGRIEVANLGQVAHTLHYFRPMAEVLAAAEAAVAAARRVGHHRAELNAELVFYAAQYETGDFASAHASIARARELVRHIGTYRFDASNLAFAARMHWLEGHREEAVAMAREAVAVCRRTGIGFNGPRSLGVLALVTDDERERGAALAEAEELLAAGAVGHNHLWFYRDAIEAHLVTGAWDEAERKAETFAALTAAEPLPWSDFVIARGRALARFGRGERSPGLGEALAAARTAGAALGVTVALPPIDEALATL